MCFLSTAILLSPQAHQTNTTTYLFFIFLGKDCTEAFRNVGHSGAAKKILEKYLVGNQTELLVVNQSVSLLHALYY